MSLNLVFRLNFIGFFWEEVFLLVIEEDFLGCDVEYRCVDGKLI